jgi:predicted patatin/cPLA2 family phospholipase
VPAILEILRRRRAAGTAPPHGDGARVALAIEGGAMRGVVSAGMVRALETLGLTRAFDAVYGSSAGAFNGAYFLAGQAALGVRVYAEDLNTRAFIDVRRALAGRPIVDLPFVIDEVIARRKPLDHARVLGAPTAFAVAATDVDTAAPALLRGFNSRDDLFGALRASATMPVIAGPPCRFRGRRYLDASITQPVPVAAAEDDGFTHVLALVTRPGGHHRSLSALIERLYVGPGLRRTSSALAEAFRRRGPRYGALLDLLAAGRGPAGRAEVLMLRPSGATVGKLECDAAILTRAAEAGEAAVLQSFE